ncbi:MAG: acyl-CoA dehydrogenase family protein, partial [Actinomycetota bacterium]
MNRTDDFSPQAAERQRLYADVDALAETVGERAADWDRDRQLDRQAFRDAAAIGLTGVEVPKYLGGLGLGFREKVTAAEILGRRSMAYAFSMINTHNVASRLAEHGAVSHKRELLPELLAGTRVGSTALTEPGAGSDFGAITTRAVRDGDGWVLNGEKAWITNATVSDVIICYAQTDPEAGSRGIASFLIDGTRPGFHRVTPYRLSGSHLIGTGGFRLEDYRAEPEDLLTEPGSGFRTALAGVNGARIYVAALCCAMVHASLVTATAYGAERQAFGQPLLKHQGLAWSLASVANKLEAGRLLTDRAIDLMDRDDGDEIILAAAHAKKFATEMAEPAIIACIQAMGAEGLRDRYPLGRHLADARVANFVDGSTEIQTERIARSLTRVYRHPTYEQPADVPDRRGHAVDRQTAAGPSTAGDGDQSEATQNSDGLSNPVATTIDPLPTTEPEQTTSARPAGGWFGESGEPSDEGSDEAAAVG